MLLDFTPSSYLPEKKTDRKGMNGKRMGWTASAVANPLYFFISGRVYRLLKIHRTLTLGVELAFRLASRFFFAGSALPAVPASILRAMLYRGAEGRFLASLLMTILRKTGRCTSI